MRITKKTADANSFTHTGIFHGDDVIAAVILELYKKLLGEELILCRTARVPEELSKDIIVFDIGFGPFDHHQKGGNGCRSNGVPYASAGLIWREYGPAIVADTPNPKKVWEDVDRQLIQGIDAVDNGALPQLDYPAQAMTLSSTISTFNPTWDSEIDTDEAFTQAFNYAKLIFENVLNRAIASAKAQGLFEEYLASTSGHIMVMEKYIPWLEYIFSPAYEKAKEIWFVVFPSNRGGYNWQCVPDKFGSFGQRKPVPNEWKGLKNEELRAVTGVSTATFCHQAGFIGGAEKLEDAIQLARLAVEA